MKRQRDIAIILAAAFVLLPVLAGAAAAAEPAATETQRFVLFQSPELSNHYGYITVNSVDVKLEGVNAVYTINYSIDPWIAFLVFLLGKQDLKNRLLKIINPLSRPTARHRRSCSSTWITKKPSFRYPTLQ